MLEYFARIGLEYDAEAKEVIAPTFRHDLFRLAVLSERIGNLYRFAKLAVFWQQ